MSSRLLIDFGVPRDTPGQVQKHRMVQVYENELYETNLLKKSRWGGEETLIKRGWARFSNFKGDRLVPKSEYADTTVPQKWSKLSHAAALEEASKAVEGRSTPQVEHRKSAITLAEEASERRKETDAGLDRVEERAEAAEEGGETDDVGEEQADDKALYGDDTSAVESDEEESEIQFWNPVCPEGYEWITAWKINRIFLTTAEGGWVYGNNLPHILKMQTNFRSRATESGSYARRRVWYRIMARIGVDPILPKPFTLPLRMSCFFDTVESKESTFLLNVYENQRWSPILFSWGSKFPGHLLFHDPSALSNADGKQRIRNWNDLAALPPGFRWANDWTVDERPGVTGVEGYLYASDFPSLLDPKGRIVLTNSPLENVRRRRWVRRMVPYKEHVRKEIELDPMPLPAMFPTSGLLRPLHGKTVKRGLHHIDMVLVHGLAGDAKDTFKGPIRLSESETFWPAEFLLSDDKFTSVYGLPAASKVPLTQSVRTLIVEHGLFLDVLDPMWTMDNAIQMLLEALKNALVGCRPIVWIGHSIGGLLIKELLHRSFKSNDNALFALTRGIIFLATPHHGASSINTILDMRIAKKSATTEYLKPCMHFHELQAWFDATDIEYINVVENCDIPSKHFSGVLASLLMKFVGLRIVQVNDGMLTMGAEPSADLNTPIRYNYLADLDHWSLGAMKIGNPTFDKIYGLVRLAVARWLRFKNQDSRTAWQEFTVSLSKELVLLMRLMYEISRTNSPITRTISALEHRTDPNVILSLMKKLTSDSPRQARLLQLPSIRELDSDNLDRMEDYLRERPHVDTFVGKYRIDIESSLCILTESIPVGPERRQKWDDIVQSYATKYVAMLSTEDVEDVKDVVKQDSVRKARVGDMLFWIELARCCKDLLNTNGVEFHRDVDFEHDEIDACVDKVHRKLMDTISEVNEDVRASVELALNRPAAVLQASIVMAGQVDIPGYAPPLLLPLPADQPQDNPSVPMNETPLYSIGENDDDLEVVRVSIPPLPVATEDVKMTSLHMATLIVSEAPDRRHSSPTVMDEPIEIDDVDSPMAPPLDLIKPEAPKLIRKVVIDDNDDLEVVPVRAPVELPAEGMDDTNAIDTVDVDVDIPPSLHSLPQEDVKKDKVDEAEEALNAKKNKKKKKKSGK